MVYQSQKHTHELKILIPVEENSKEEVNENESAVHSKYSNITSDLKEVLRDQTTIKLPERSIEVLLAEVNSESRNNKRVKSVRSEK